MRFHNPVFLCLKLTLNLSKPSARLPCPGRHESELAIVNSPYVTKWFHRISDCSRNGFTPSRIRLDIAEFSNWTKHQIIVHSIESRLNLAGQFWWIICNLNDYGEWRLDIVYQAYSKLDFDKYLIWFNIVSVTWFSISCHQAEINKWYTPHLPLISSYDVETCLSLRISPARDLTVCSARAPFWQEIV